MINKYRIRVEFRRRVKSPEYGPQAYHNEGYEHEFTYGKGKDYESSKEGVADLKKLLFPFQGYFNEIEIWVMRGGSGILAERITGPMPDSLWDSGIETEFCDKILNRCYEVWPYCDTDPKVIGDVVTPDTSQC